MFLFNMQDKQRTGSQYKGSMCSFPKETRHMIENEYLDGKSAKELAQEVGTTPRTIQRYLKQCGVIRTPKEAYTLAIKMGRMTYDHLRVDEKTKSRRKIINPALRYKIFSRDNFKCRVCGRCADDGAKLQVDHIKSLVDGGSNNQENLQTLCRECNVGKYQVNPIHRGKRKD